MSHQSTLNIFSTIFLDLLDDRRPLLDVVCLLSFLFYLPPVLIPAEWSLQVTVSFASFHHG